MKDEDNPPKDPGPHPPPEIGEVERQSLIGGGPCRERECPIARNRCSSYPGGWTARGMTVGVNSEAEVREEGEALSAPQPRVGYQIQPLGQMLVYCPCEAAARGNSFARNRHGLQEEPLGVSPRNEPLLAAKKGQHEQG